MAKTLTTKITELANAIGTDIKQVNNRTGLLTALDVDFSNNGANTSLVAAINHALTVAKNAQSASGATIDDTLQSDTTTYSSQKIESSINTSVNTAINDIVGLDAPETFDTIKEIGDFIESNETAIGAITNKVPYNEIKTIEDTEKQNVWTTIGIGDMSENFVATYEAAKV